MTYRGQITLSIAAGIFGATLMLPDILLTGFARAETNEQLVVRLLSMAGMSVAWLALAFGTVLRSLMRSLWLHALRYAELPNLDGRLPADIILRSPFAGFWRWWLHIDHEGNDRDART